MKDIDFGLFDEPLEIDDLYYPQLQALKPPSMLDTYTQLYQRPFEIDYRELVVNQKRLDAINIFLKSSQQILIIKGPSGSGKTTAIWALLKRDGITPIDGHTLDSINRPRLNLIGEGSLMKRDGGLVLFDNLPLIDSQKKIQNSLLNAGNNKIILCITGSGSGGYGYGGNDCMDQRSIEHSKYLHSLEDGNTVIEFIPFSQTSINKVLKGIKKKSHSDGGSDLSNILIHSLLDTASGRDESFAFLHSLGKLLYGNKERERKLDPIEICSKDPFLFRKYLHHNYPYHLSNDGDSLSHLSAISHYFSLSDNVINSFSDFLGELSVFWGVGDHKKGRNSGGGGGGFIPIKSPYNRITPS